MATRRILRFNLLQNHQQLRNARKYQKRVNPFEIYTDHEFYQRYRFDKDSVLYLAGIFCQDLIPSTRRSQPVSSDVQMLVTLRFLASGALYQVIGDCFGLDKSTVCRIIWRVIQRIVNKLNDFVKLPQGDECYRSARIFKDLCNFPGVIGAIDGTHVLVSPPAEQEFAYVNRKGRKSLNVQVACNEKWEFINVYAHWPGSCHDSFILKQSKLWNVFENGSQKGVLLGDSGYPLRSWLMLPYINPSNRPQRHYNYGQMRARCLIEQAIGQLKRRFRPLHDGIRVIPERAQLVIVASVILHNIAKKRNQPDLFDDCRLIGLEEEAEDLNDYISLPDGSDIFNGKIVRDQIVETFFS